MKKNKAAANICKYGSALLSQVFHTVFVVCSSMLHTFYLFQNSKLVGNTKMKRVLLKSNPTVCLGDVNVMDVNRLMFSTTNLEDQYEIYIQFLIKH